MKRWCTAVLALALLTVPPFVTTGYSVPSETAIVGESCCCASSDEHHETAACPCGDCAGNSTAHCGCAPFLSGLTPEKETTVTLSVCGSVRCDGLLYVTRTDPPLRRPPIFS